MHSAADVPKKVQKTSCENPRRSKNRQQYKGLGLSVVLGAPGGPLGRPSRDLFSFWVHFELLGGGLGAFLERFWDPLGSSWGSLDVFWVPLGRSWGSPVVLLGPSGFLLGRFGVLWACPGVLWACPGVLLVVFKECILCTRAGINTFSASAAFSLKAARVSDPARQFFTCGRPLSTNVKCPHDIGRDSWEWVVSPSPEGPENSPHEVGEGTRSWR